MSKTNKFDPKNVNDSDNEIIIICGHYSKDENFCNNSCEDCSNLMNKVEIRIALKAKTVGVVEIKTDLTVDGDYIESLGHTIKNLQSADMSGAIFSEMYNNIYRNKTDKINYYYVIDPITSVILEDVVLTLYKTGKVDWLPMNKVHIYNHVAKVEGIKRDINYPPSGSEISYFNFANTCRRLLIK